MKTSIFYYGESERTGNSIAGEVRFPIHVRRVRRPLWARPSFIVCFWVVVLILVFSI